MISYVHFLDFHYVTLQNRELVFTSLSAEGIMSQVKPNAKGDAPDGLSLALLTLGKKLRSNLNAAEFKVRFFSCSLWWHWDFSFILSA